MKENERKVKENESNIKGKALQNKNEIRGKYSNKTALKNFNKLQKLFIAYLN